MACSKDFYSNEDENTVAGYDFKPVEEDKALECPICMLLLQQTMGTPCSHLFCLACLQKLTGKRDIRGTTFRCPVCNNVVDTNQVFPNAYIDRCVRGSNVYCQQEKAGCTWKGTIAEYFNKHENECDFKIVPCKYEECEVSEMRRRMNDHEVHCPFRIVQCNYCTIEVKENELNKHYQFCEKFPINCKENGCNIIVPKNEMVDHLSTCDFLNVHCSYMRFGCMDKVARKDIEKHLEVNTQRHMTFVCEKYHNMEEILRNTTELIEIQSAKIVKQDTEIEKLKTDNATQFVNIENQKKQIKQLNKRISLLETKPKVTLTKNQNEQNLKIPSCPAVDINELLLKGADRWIRRKKIDFDENNYAVWFKKIFDWMNENTLYRYDNVMYVKIKIERRKTVGWCSNSKKEQEKSKAKYLIHKGKDGLLLEGPDFGLDIHTETLDVFYHENSSGMIIHPHQQQKMMRMKQAIHCAEYNYYFVHNVPDYFHVNNFIIVCLIKN